MALSPHASHQLSDVARPSMPPKRRCSDKLSSPFPPGIAERFDAWSIAPPRRYRVLRNWREARRRARGRVLARAAGLIAAGCTGVALPLSRQHRDGSCDALADFGSLLGRRKGCLRLLECGCIRLSASESNTPGASIRPQERTSFPVGRKICETKIWRQAVCTAAPIASAL
jgi:hypothetical protein